MLSSFKKNVCLKNFSTFHIGGPASYFHQINNQNDAITTLQYLHQKQIPYIILGKGSNCLFDDKGFEGVVVLNKINQYHITQQGLLTVGSGHSFGNICWKVSCLGFSGLEFGIGIPGSVGGAIYMNAGAHNSETSHHLSSVTYINTDFEIIREKKENLLFAYRKSYFQKFSFFILEALFRLQKKSLNNKNLQDLNKKRYISQPLKHKSAGCIFKNPTSNISAGFLIDSCGLKGVVQGDAEISQKHANFIINKGRASASDVLYLIKKIKTTVFNKTGILLEEEVKIIPFKKDL